jgi:hypothetical protein
MNIDTKEIIIEEMKQALNVAIQNNDETMAYMLESQLLIVNS